MASTIKLGSNWTPAESVVRAGNSMTGRPWVQESVRSCLDTKSSAISLHDAKQLHGNGGVACSGGEVRSLWRLLTLAQRQLPAG